MNIIKPVTRKRIKKMLKYFKNKRVKISYEFYIIT
jgi:hypothetical protein